MFSRAFAVVAYVIGLLGASAFFLYVLATGTGLLMRGETIESGPSAWLTNAALLALFALQHSGMARTPFKQLWTRVIPAHLERSVYVLAAGVTILALTLLWQPLPGAPIWHGPIAIVAVSLTAAVLLMGCCAWFNHPAFFGLQQAWTGSAQVHWPLRIEGPYRYVRHPLMLGVLIALWAQPIMPPELLMLNVGMTIYILAAIPLEERDLVREYGEDYERYRRDVPMLIPWKWH